MQTVNELIHILELVREKYGEDVLVVTPIISGIVGSIDTEIISVVHSGENYRQVYNPVPGAKNALLIS